MRRRRAAVYLTAAVAVGIAAGCSTPHYVPRGATYYVSPHGDDRADGTSAGKAWRTLARADKAALHPGDRLLLQGGARFAGTVTIGARDAGDARRPVTVGSYGGGRATIAATGTPGVSVHDTAGVEIRDLTLSGPGARSTGEAGVNLYADKAGAGAEKHVTVTGVDISGFRVGMAMGSAAAGTGFRDVTVRDADLHGNRDAGLLTYGPAFDVHHPAYAHENLLLEDVRAYDNAGDPTASHRHTGNGIVLGGVRHATVRDSTAHDNGDQSARHAPAGPVGMWAYDSTRVLIEHSSSYRNHTGADVDGSGFGLDSNTSHSVVQYNVSYQNDGSGYYVYSHPANGAHADNTIRDNVSADDARKLPQHGALTVYGSRVHDLRIYQNTVTMSHSPGGDGTVVLLRPGNSGISLRNNILVSDGDPLVTADRVLTPAQVVFQGNQYHAASGHWTVRWGGHRYTDLAAWRDGTGQERVNGKPSGTSAAPCLKGGALPAPATPGDVGLFTPRCAQDGLDLTALFGIDPGTVDVLGHKVPTPPVIGAVQP
ncbi:right-handed parallel beta-helix repeat-containing protein [Streptomyces sp. NPDC087512]|uniref:right-handed parallel beta-helix repeat-containing protein n=1 Tax=Streptomyces sp. NPDC087512 TaxID=3155059 RepID=UPI003438848A